jgi:hypothetical protein
VQERGVLNLTEEEYESLVPSVQMVVQQQRALVPGARALNSAQQALMRGDQAEYENQMAAAARAVDLAAAENPSAKPMLQAAFGMNELVALTMAQQRDFDRFDFDRVSDGVARIEARSKQVASSEAIIKRFLPLAWIPVMASTVTSLAQATERLSQLLRTLLSGGPAAKHLEELSRLKDEIQEQQQILRELKAPALADGWRMLLLGVADKLLERTERLGVEVRPSRQTLVNLAGLAATISFVTVAALLLAVGRLTGTELNGGVVLALSAFFGLVGGFGYGALRFQGFLTSVLFGQGRKGNE